MIKATKFAALIIVLFLIKLRFLSTTLRTQHDLRGHNECHLSMSVLGNISTAFLALSVDGNISIYLMDYYFRMDFK